MAEVCKVCRITMDMAVKPAMHVHRKDRSIMTFQEYKSGLYYYDTAAIQPPAPILTSPNRNDYLFLNTVAGNKEKYELCISC
jgi:hypothetical protein